MMTSLLRPTPPWLLRFDGMPAEAYELTVRLGQRGVVARVVRGTKMRRYQGLFDEFGAALQFPDYFGENWAAFDECLGDLEWLPGEAYALVVTQAEELLVDEEPDALNTFLRIIETVASTWASPIAEGERWDRAAVPFHCVLQARRDGESHKDLRSLDGVAPLVLDELDC